MDPSRAYSEVILKKMYVKLRKISEITATLPFTEFDFMQKYRESFAVSELGRIHAQLPLKELAEKVRSHFPKTHPQGNTPMFPPEGEVALSKQIGQWNRICKIHTVDITLTEEQSKRLSALKEVCRQQSALAQKKEVKHRIVSIDRPYIRPIVRGKENKRVEFGAKVNNIQIDGISFIEHHSFEAFNEGVRLQDCIEYQQELTGIKVTRVGADTIYANNDNRRYCTENGITTCFVRKGPKPKDEDADISTARRIIGTLRSTAMEGSFGNQKQHYGVGRIAARNSRSETLLLFFGIHMANAATLAARQLAIEEKEKQRQKQRA